MGQSFDSTAIARLFEEHYGLMVTVTVRYAPLPDLVYDIIQQVFIDFIEDAAKGKRDYQKDIAPFLATLTKNRAIDFWREHSKHSPESLQRIVERFAEKQDVEESARDIGLVAMRNCMKKLPPTTRQMVERHYYHGTSMEDIARQEQRKVTTIRSFFCRIRQKLRECIERET